MAKHITSGEGIRSAHHGAMTQVQTQGERQRVGNLETRNQFCVIVRVGGGHNKDSDIEDGENFIN